MAPAPLDTTIPTLGPCQFHSPLHRIGAVEAPFKCETARILYHSHPLEDGRDVSTPCFEAASAREMIYFDPAKTTVGSMNQRTHQFGSSRINGFRYGYEGLVQRTIGNDSMVPDKPFLVGGELSSSGEAVTATLAAASRCNARRGGGCRRRQSGATGRPC